LNENDKLNDEGNRVCVCLCNRVCTQGLNGWLDFPAEIGYRNMKFLQKGLERPLTSGIDVIVYESSVNVL
jgi:hypothetical protein